jgi:hypothetical protein
MRAGRACDGALASSCMCPGVTGTVFFTALSVTVLIVTQCSLQRSLESLMLLWR